MDMITSIISSLGIDSTLFIQLGIYLVAFVILYLTAFRPYFEASEARRALTSGNLEDASKADEVIRKSEEKYQTRARQLNEEISMIYKNYRSEGVKKSDEILASATKTSKDIMTQAQQKLSDEMELAQAKIEPLSNEISAVIVSQLMSKRGKTK